jgi:hypothetical protein
VISFEATNTKDLENQVNTFLRDETDITATSISYQIRQSDESGKNVTLFSALLLYSFPD